MQPILYMLCWTLLAGIHNGHRWVVQKESHLSITGHTNVNRFTCGVAQYATPDTICFLPEGSRGNVPGIPLCGAIRLNIDDFDCHNRTMTTDFKQTAMATRFPQLKISFINLERMPVPAGERMPVPTRDTIKGWVEIELAGACRLFEVDYTIGRNKEGNLELTGVRKVLFRDFALNPPTKIGGMIRVSDSLDVCFTLSLQQID